MLLWRWFCEQRFVVWPMVSQVNGRKRFFGLGLKEAEEEDGYSRIKLKGIFVGRVREAWSLESV